MGLEELLYTNHLIKQDKLTRRNKDEMKSHFSKVRFYPFLSIGGIFLSITFAIYLVIPRKLLLQTY